MNLCSQCKKSEALVPYGEHLLCLNCYERLMKIETDKYNMLAAEENRLMDEMDAVTGVYGVTPRIKLLNTMPLVDNRKITYNNIKVDNSVIGAINTGEIKQLDVSIDYLKNKGHEELAQQIQELTETILNWQEKDDILKGQLLEQLNFLIAEAKLSKEKRKYGIIKSILHGMKDTLALIPTAILIWDKIQPILNKILGS
jgi:hypothetical protein